MAQKRKSSSNKLPNPKRLQKQQSPRELDLIHEEDDSDVDYTLSDDGSIHSDSQKDTPTTPFSPCSVRYPSELKTHLCPFEGCTKAFNRPARLQEHLRSHNNERLFECPYASCDKNFLRISHLNHHVKSAHTSIRDYVCDRSDCGKSFVTGSRLRRHLAAHDGRDKYRCTEFPPCSETFRKHSTLQKHVVAVHLKQKPFPCPNIDSNTGRQCSMAFETAGHLRAHQGRMHTEKRFSCSECSRQGQRDGQLSTTDINSGDISGDGYVVAFPTYALLQAHLRSVHPPQCPNCPVTCSTSRELRRHLEVAHGDVNLEQRKIFPCTVPGCDRSFTKSGNLTVHIRTVHEGEKRFVCGETDLSTSKKVQGWTGEGCGKRYGSKLALEEHIRTAHLGFPNAKAERRQRLCQGNKEQPKRQPSAPSKLATLTGEGYAEETGRGIPCFFETCTHRFHRDYDLWVHMGGKHRCTEDEIQNLFLRRALLAADGDGDGAEKSRKDGELPHDNTFGMYDFEYDVGGVYGDEDQDRYPEQYHHPPNDDFGNFRAAAAVTTPTNSTLPMSDKNYEYAFEYADNLEGSVLEQVNVDSIIRDDDYEICGDGDGNGKAKAAENEGSSVIPNNSDMTLVDPVLSCNLVDG